MSSPWSEIGPYRAVRPLGRGGAGEVYLARDTRLRRPVAIKRLRPDRRGDPLAVARALREARTLATFSHPAIVPIYDLVEDPEGAWIVMEFIDGPSLAAILEESGPLPIPRILDVGAQVAAGLAEAHRHGILHRDLKAENVLIDDRGRIRLVDFGLAKAVAPSPEETALSAPGTVVGTGRAMSPEQARGLELCPRSDLFAFGVLLYEMTTGSTPFAGASAADTLLRLCTEAHPPIRRRRPDAPDGLAALIDALLQKAIEHRPADAETARRRLVDRAAGEAASIARRPDGDADGSPRRVGDELAGVDSVTRPAFPAAPAGRPGTRRRHVGVSAALVAVFAAGLAALTTLDRSGSTGSGVTATVYVPEAPWDVYAHSSPA
ncbi:MAG: serine/threonine-protein kinase, partial [Acidobacteriota bacterium]